MALPRVYRVCQDSAGNVLPGVLCSVFNQGSGVLATLWQNDAATLPQVNPLTSDATYGSIGFYVAPGHYDLTFTKSGYVIQPHMDMQVPADTVTLGSMATVNSPVPIANGGTAATDAATARINLGLASMATQGHTAVNITGGTIAGLTALGTNNAQITGGSVTGLTALGTNNAQITGGSVTGLTVLGTNNAQITGGSVTGLTAFNADAPTLHVDSANHRVGIGTTTPTQLLTVNGPLLTYDLTTTNKVIIGAPIVTVAKVELRWDKSFGHGIAMINNNDAGGGFTQQFLNSTGVQVGSISQTGSATAFNTTSDSRLKEAVEDLPEPLAVVQALRPVAFRWRADGSPGHGFLAGEVQQVVPGVITGEADAVDEAGNVLPMQIDNSKLVPWLVGAVKELTAQVAALSTRLEACGG
jgi:hypothetical protein